MKPIWIIEDFLQDRSVKYLVDEIKAQGMEAVIWDVKSFMDMHQEIEKEHRKYPGERCIIFVGSIGMVQNIQRYAKWVPGTWSNFKELECKNYYTYLGEYLFNEDHAFLPVGEFKRKIQWCFDTFGSEDTIFIRPDASSKSFSGQQLHKERLDIDLQWIVDPMFSKREDLIVISSPKNIEKEFRFIVADREVITGSLYKIRGVVIQHPEVDPGALELAQKVAKIPYTMDRMTVVDICMTPEGKYYLLEVGGFSCAGLYSCDRALIVKHASRIALEEFNDFQEQNG